MHALSFGPSKFTSITTFLVFYLIVVDDYQSFNVENSIIYDLEIYI